MQNIGQGYGGIPVYFIRWNPDEYQTKNQYSSNDSIANRYQLLANYTKDIIECRVQLPSALVSTIYLYYDNWNGLSNESWKIITQYES